MKQINVRHFEGDGDTEELVELQERLKNINLDFFNDKQLKTIGKRLEYIAGELVKNKMLYSPNSGVKFIFQIKETEDQSLTVTWKDVADATPKHIRAFKKKFENAVKLQKDGKDTIKAYITNVRLGNVEQTEKNQESGQSAGIGFLEMAKRTKSMAIKFDQPDGEFVPYTIKFEL